MKDYLRIHYYRLHIQRFSFLIAFSFIFGIHFCYSQKIDYSYVPEPLFNKVEDLLLDYEEFESAELAQLKNRNSDKQIREHIEAAIENRTESLEKMVEDDDLILEGKLVEYVQGVMDRIVLAAGIVHRVRVAIIRNESPNAFNSGDNYVYIHLGLITRLLNEDALAFVLAHELAHNEEEHFYSRVTAYAELSENDSINLRIAEIRRSGYGHVTALNELLVPWILTSKENSRKFESDADNIAFVWCSAAGYDLSKALGIFDVLGFGEHELDTVVFDLKKELYLSDLKHDFTAAMQAEYGSSLGEFVQEKDTLEDLLRTHPFSVERKEILNQRLGQGVTQSFELDSNFAQIRYWAEVELLAALMYQNQIDRAILNSISYLRKDKNHAMAKETLVLSFAYLGRSKDRRQSGKLIAIHNNDYDDVYNELIYFLRKISPEQCHNISRNLVTEFEYPDSSPVLNPIKCIYSLIEDDLEDYELRLSVEFNKPEKFYTVQILEQLINQ